MSLVYEALEKAAREKNRFAPPPPSAPLPAAPAPVPVVAAPKRAWMVWIGGLSLVAVGVVGVLIFSRKPAELAVPQSPPTSIAAPAPSKTVQPAPVAPVAVPPPVPTTDNSPAADARFKLSGIMKYGDEYSAVINGHIVTRDQSVSGAIVKAVAQDQVTLHVDGRDVVLRLF